jgi:PadR family transcriptional regulator, regulatory protein PadR
VGIERITEPTLDVLEALLAAHQQGRDIHGWEIKKATHRSGPTVYGVIDRLEDAQLVEGHWEQQDPCAQRPRRRYYRLTGVGVLEATKLITGRVQRPRVKARTLRPGFTAGFGGLR